MSALALEKMIAEAVLEVLRPELEALRAEVARLRAANEPAIPIGEAAERLHVTVREVQRRLKDGRLEAVHMGGERRVVWPPRMVPG